MNLAQPDEDEEVKYNSHYVQQALLAKTPAATIFRGIILQLQLFHKYLRLGFF